MIPLSLPIAEPMVKREVMVLTLLVLNVKLTAVSGRGVHGLLARPHAKEAPKLGQGSIVQKIYIFLNPIVQDRGSQQ